MAGLFASPVVEVPRPEYEKLVRESERNDIIRSLVHKNKYISTEDLKTILDVEESQEKEGEE